MKKSPVFGKMTKLLSIVLCLALLVTVFSNLSQPIVANASDIEIWDGTNTVSLSGSGTQADPYTVSNGAELKYLVSLSEAKTTGKYYVITKDIYLNDPSSIAYDSNGYAATYTGRNWPSGSTSSYVLTAFGVFAGNLDGQGHKIVGLFNKSAPAGHWGLFQTLGANAVVKNVNIESAYYKRAQSEWERDNSYISGIAGVTSGSNVSVSGCTVYRSTFTEAASGYINFGGIIGKSDAYTGIAVSNCGVYVSTSVNTSSGYLCGGIMADNWSGVNGAVEVNNCWSNIYPAGKSNINNSARIIYTNCYTLNSNSSSLASSAPSGISIVSGSLVGADATNTMPDIGWGTNWNIVENNLPLPKEEVAQQAVEIWDGTNSAPTEGTGTPNDPYIISTGAHLAYIATVGQTETQGKYYKLANDIYLNNPANYTYDANGYANKLSAHTNCWPSGGQKNYTLVDATFAGHLNGDGHTIFGMYNDWAPNGHWALFARLGGGSSVQNVNIDSIYYQPNTGTTWSESVNYYTSSIASAIEGNNITISGCTVTRSTFNDGAKWKKCGGLIGCAYAYSGIKFSHCSFDANIIGGAYGMCWGIYNDAWNGSKGVTVKNCWSNQKLYELNSVGHVVFEDCYTLSDTVTEGITSVSSYTINQLVGETAKTAMPNLDWGYTWKTVGDSAPVIAYENFDSSWKDTGDGTRANPYKIVNANTLFNAIYTTTVIENDAYAGKYFVLENDIVINDNDAFTFPIYATTRNWIATTNPTGFKACLDGKGHTISGLYSTNTVDGGMTGLVPVLGEGGLVSNINLENSYISSTGTTWNSAGGIVGALGDSAHCKIYGCHVADDVKVISTGGGYSGGIVGVANRGGTGLRIAYCSSAADVQGDYAGKIAAGGWDVANTTVAHCLAIGGSTIDADKAATFAVNENNVENVSIETVKSATVKELGLDETAWVKSIGALVSTYYIETAWNGGTDQYFDGEGTQSNPFKIYAPEQLRAAVSVADLTEGHLNHVYFEIMNDITLTDSSVSGWRYLASNWATSSDFKFMGSIDGNGHTVKGVYCTSSAAAGFISQASDGTTVKDLHLEDAYVCGQIPGGIIGYVTAAGIEVDGCSVINSEIAKTSGSPYTSGGIVGTAVTALTVTNSFSANNTGAENGIIGKAWGDGNTVVSNCYSVGAPAYISIVGPTPTNVYQMNVSGTVADGTTTVTSYNQMTGLFSDTDNTWYQAYGLAPQLVNKGINYLRPDINGNGLRDDLDATSLAALRSHLLSVDGYELDNAIGNVNGDSSGGVDVVDIRDLVHIKKCIAEDEETSKIAQEKVDEYSYGTDSLPIANNGTYSLVWADEFGDATTRYNRPDANMWVNTTNMGGLSDAKLNVNNTTIENGQLKLRTFKIDDDYDGEYPDVYSIPYSCATSSTMNYRYGYAEIRARIPTISASWSSFWALTAKEEDPIYSNTNSALGNTNVDFDTTSTHTAEVDIFEICGSSKLVPNIHAWPKSSGSHISTGASSGGKAITTDTWHTIGFEWTPTQITMYCDGVAYQTYNVSSLDYRYRYALNSPIFLIFNSHLFTKDTRETLWDSGSLDDSAYAVGDMVTEYVIDYVRLYQSSLYDNQFYAVNPYNAN